MDNARKLCTVYDTQRILFSIRIASTTDLLQLGYLVLDTWVLGYLVLGTWILDAWYLDTWTIEYLDIPFSHMIMFLLRFLSLYEACFIR